MKVLEGSGDGIDLIQGFPRYREVFGDYPVNPIDLVGNRPITRFWRIGERSFLSSPGRGVPEGELSNSLLLCGLLLNSPL